METLSRLEKLSNRATREIDRSGDVLRLHLAQEGKQGLWRSSPEREPSRTGTAFCLALVDLAGVGLAPFVAEQRQLQTFLSGSVAASVEPISSTTAGQDQSKTGNAYNTSVRLSGIFSFAKLNPSFRKALENHAGVSISLLSLIEAIRERESLTRVSSRLGASSSAYLTYWAMIALTNFVDSNTSLKEVESREVGRALRSIVDWAEVAVSRLLASHHAGLRSQFDVVECICAASIILRAEAGAIQTVPEEYVQLATHAVSVVLEHYFAHGSLEVSRPVYSDENNNAILCGTVEAFVYLLSSLSNEVRTVRLNNLPQMLLPAFEKMARAHSAEGYPPDLDATFSFGATPHLFSNTAAFAFSHRFFELVDGELDLLARNALNVSPETPKGFDLAEPLQTAVTKKIVEPMRDPLRKPHAKYSMILFGPPGTAKTSIAKKIAQELDWPLKEITQSDFLTEGRDLIESNAERIFTLCRYLKNVVILFDELEELILARSNGADDGPAGSDKESRLLTTSMLPKIHELRDRKRSVFIFATNRLGSLDSAATRLGRFDIIFGVGYASPESLRTAMAATADALKKIEPKYSKVFEQIKEFVAGADMTKILDTTGNKKPLLTYKDAEYVVEYVGMSFGSEAVKANQVAEAVTKEVSRITDLNTTENKRFVALKDEHDRLWIPTNQS